jgi:PEP-CTERM/exosortase A-associated glycosyltransferase
MRILHVLDHSIPVLDGYSVRTLSILRHQRELGWDTLHVTGPKHEIPGPPVEQVDGWEFFRTPASRSLWSRLPLVQYAVVIADLSRRVAEVARSAKPDLLHAHSPALNGLAALRVGRRLHLPVVYEVRALWEDAAVGAGMQSEGGLRYRLSRALESLTLREADAITTICEGLRGDILKRGIPGRKVTVIPNAVDAAAFGTSASTDPDLAQRLGLAGKLVLGFIGSFYRYEGLHFLIEALPRLLAANPNIRLLLVGGGEDDAMLRRLALESGLAGAVVFAGRVPHAEVARYYDLVDMLVYPRLPIRLNDLVTPLKPLEAMARGKVVLAADVGGLRELIRDDDTGFLFRAGDAEALAARVLEVGRRRAEWPAMGVRARRFVQAERNWEGSVARYRAVYDRLIAA